MAPKIMTQKIHLGRKVDIDSHDTNISNLGQLKNHQAMLSH